MQVQVGAVGGIVQAPGSQFNDFRVDFPWSLPIKPVSFTARFSYRGFICSGFRLVKRQLVQDDFHLGDSSGHFSCGFHLYCCSTVVEISVCPRNETHFVGIWRGTPFVQDVRRNGVRWTWEHSRVGTTVQQDEIRDIVCLAVDLPMSHFWHFQKRGDHNSDSYTSSIESFCRDWHSGALLVWK